MVIIMNFQSFPLLVAFCLIGLFHIVVSSPAKSPFNAQKLANRANKRGNVLRRSFSKESVRYFLYPNATNPDEIKVLRVGDIVSLQSYNASKGLTMIVHGFKQNTTDKYPQELKNALLKTRDSTNIILIGWQEMNLPFKNPHSGQPLSTREASKNVQRVSKHVTDMLMFLKNESKLHDANDIHFIGHGLGAHIAGVVAFRLKNAITIARITGLDPSPAHSYQALSEKLDTTDANFVDVMHTSNVDASFGHLDFYPNGGGPTQPQCVLPDNWGFPGSCSSNMAWDYYVRSVLENLTACGAKSFLSYKLGKGCEKEVQFGHRVSPRSRGDYFLSIRSQEQVRMNIQI